MRFVGIIVALSVISAPAWAAYNGAPDWKAPKQAVCMGVAGYDKGMTVEPKDVMGGSLDRYIFMEADGAMGIFYFDIAHVSPLKMPLKGEVTYIDTGSWKVMHYPASCTFTY